MDKATYIKTMYSILVPLCQKYGYYNVAGGMIAQSIQEGWDSLLATKYHNYWGMKASKDYKGNNLATYLNISVVDESVFNVTEDNTRILGK